MDNTFILILEELSATSKLPELNNFIQHRNFTRLQHCVFVAYLSYLIGKKFHSVNIPDLVRGALLHDYYFYPHEKNPQRHTQKHALISLQNASRDVPDLTVIEKNIIYSHMFPLNITHIPKTKEAIIVSFSDKVCAMCELFHFNLINRRKLL